MNPRCWAMLILLSCASYRFVSAQESEATQPELWLKGRLEWFQDLKFGIMLHWGAYSQWGCIESWPLVEEDNWARPSDLAAWKDRGEDMQRFSRDYWALPKSFDPVRFDPQSWATIAKESGMKYVVFTTKHHDGFAMFDSHLTDYRITSQDVPFHHNSKSNIVSEVFDVFRAQGFAIGAYFSKADWHRPFYWSPESPARTRNPKFETRTHPETWSRFVEFTHGQIEELMTGYGAIDILWLDAGQVRPPEQDIQMDRLASMARRHQPRLIIVDRTVGGRYENYRTPEQEVPDKPLPYAWETCMTLGDQWSFKPNDHYKSAFRVVQLLVDIVGKGGNFLLNIGPQPNGELPSDAVAKLREVGFWLKVNGEAIYGTRPLPPFKSQSVVFTQKGTFGYAIYLPANEQENLPEELAIDGIKLEPNAAILLLDSEEHLLWKKSPDGRFIVTIPRRISDSPPCRYAFVFKFEIPATPSAPS